MKTSTSEWLRAAADDLVLIDRIVEDERLTHLVAFHAQQCVEKAKQFRDFARTVYDKCISRLAG